MINAKELRIGNYHINPSGQIRQMTITRFRWGLQYFHRIQPIPLTEELLLKCGLGQVGLYFVSELLGIGVGTLRFALKKIKNHFFIECGGKYIRVESLHELQNIYLFITKRELKIEI